MSLENILLGAVKTVGTEIIGNALDSKEIQHKTSIVDDEQDIVCKKKASMEDNREIEQKHTVSLINAYGRNKRLGVMVICAVLGLIICLLILSLCRDNLSGEVIGIVSTISGIFGACLKDAYSFEFGSSRGSREKDERLSATLLDHLKS